MNKLYYTDPIAASYMAREFGVLFNFGSKIAADEKDILYEFLERRRQYTHYYIHPDSYGIFEPLYDDVGIDQENNVCVRGCCEDWALENGLADEKGFIVEGNVKIIYRNGKPFFMPEVENE